jgi:hypothetical protein
LIGDSMILFDLPGDAFFNVELRKADTLRNAFTKAQKLVREWELREGFDPSNPQIAGGTNVDPLLIVRKR